jgi:bacterioferritin-associated ferredoxin
MRWRSALLTVCSALALAACGGDNGQQAEQETVTRPTIDRAVADNLAARSEEVANLLDAGNVCGAREKAALLREDVTAAINEGEIPEPYLEDLSGLVNEIEAGIPACELQPPPGDNEDEDEKKKEEEKKDKGGGDGDD